MWLHVAVVILQTVIRNANANSTSGEDLCKLDYKSKIVNGVEVDPVGRYPFMVGLMESYNASERPVCGGSLIASDWVLTEDYCAMQSSYVIIGRHDFCDESEVVEVIEIDRKIPYLENNIGLGSPMLIKLKKSSKARPVRLMNAPNDAAVTVMGWGWKAHNSPFNSNVLMEVELDVFSDDKCFDVIREALLAMVSETDETYTDLQISQFLEGMVCADREGKDTCLGDQGGPLIVKGESGEDDIQVGISVEPFCNEYDIYYGVPFPGLYIGVGDIYEWINMSAPVNLEDPDDDKTDNACEDGIIIFHSLIFHSSRRKNNT